MKNCLQFRQCLLFIGLILPMFSFTQEDLRTHADELFRESHYYDAFFLYRQLYGNVVSENVAAQRCSHAMALTKKFNDYKAMGKTFEARMDLQELLVVNPYDFHKPELVKMTFEEAQNLQKMAFRQQTAQETNNMLDKAIGMYEQSANLGWKSDDVDFAIKQCQSSKTDSQNYIRALEADTKMLTPRTPEPLHKSPIVIFLKN